MVGVVGGVVVDEDQVVGLAEGVVLLLQVGVRVLLLDLLVHVVFDLLDVVHFLFCVHLRNFTHVLDRRLARC